MKFSNTYANCFFLINKRTELANNIGEYSLLIINYYVQYHDVSLIFAKI